MFLHRLEKGGLGLGRGTVDFVSEDDLRENRSFLEHQFAMAGSLVFLDDIGARNVCGH